MINMSFFNIIILFLGFKYAFKLKIENASRFK
jgi:hypothetical protein